MHQNIIDYLQQNKNQYTQSSLVEQLRKAGHSEDMIAQSVQAVYGTADTSSESPTPMQAQVKYAGFWMRVLAYIIDAIVIGVLMMIILSVLGSSIARYDATGLSNVFITITIVILYYFVMTTVYQATLGKMALDMKVCDATTLQKASSGTIATREIIGRMISFLPIGNLVHVTVAFTQKKQGVHDMIAKTVVIQKNNDEKKSVVIVAIILVAVLLFIVIGGIFSTIMLVSLSSARSKAREAGVKSSISSTVPSAILCMDDGFDLTDPIPGQPLCVDSEGVWPSLEPDGQWDAMQDADVSDGTFAYTAAYGDDLSKYVVCTQRGCAF